MCPNTCHVLAAIGTLVPCDDPSQQRVRAGSPGRLSGALPRLRPAAVPFGLDRAVTKGPMIVDFNSAGSLKTGQGRTRHRSSSNTSRPQPRARQTWSAVRLLSSAPIGPLSNVQQSFAWTMAVGRPNAKRNPSRERPAAILRGQTCVLTGRPRDNKPAAVPDRTEFLERAIKHKESRQSV